MCGLQPPLGGPWHLQLQEAVPRVLLRPGVGSPTCDGGGPFPDLSGCCPQKPQKKSFNSLLLEAQKGSGPESSYFETLLF